MFVCKLLKCAMKASHSIGYLWPNSFIFCWNFKFSSQLALNSIEFCPFWGCPSRQMTSKANNLNSKCIYGIFNFLLRTFTATKLRYKVHIFEWRVEVSLPSNILKSCNNPWPRWYDYVCTPVTGTSLWNDLLKIFIFFPLILFSDGW